jgi:hypothetical protein
MPTEKVIEEIWAIIESTKALQKENAEGMKELREAQNANADQQKANAAEMKASDARMKEETLALKKSLQALKEELGGMGSSNGEYAEDYFANAMEKKMFFAGQHFDEMATNLKAKAGGVQDEFDIVLYNGESVAIIEIKYKARTEDLDHMVNKKVQNFRTLFPHYKDYKVYLGLGSMSFNEHVYAKAKELGIGLLKQKGETVEAEPGYVKAY